MRAYEVMVILDPSLEERIVEPSLDKYLNVIRNDGGTVESVDVWGRRRLAYEVKKNAEGIYAVINLSAEPATVKEFDRQLSLGVIMPLLGYRTAMKRAGLDVPSGYFHDLATWSNINRMYESKVMNEVRQVRFEAKQPELLDRLVRVLDEQRGHTLAMEIEDAKIALSSAPKSSIALDWIEPGLAAGVARKELVGYTTSLAERITARIAGSLNSQLRLASSTRMMSGWPARTSASHSARSSS